MDWSNLVKLSFQNSFDQFLQVGRDKMVVNIRTGTHICMNVQVIDKKCIDLFRV